MHKIQIYLIWRISLDALPIQILSLLKIRIWKICQQKQNTYIWVNLEI